jgi:hypothetical protein
LLKTKEYNEDIHYPILIKMTRSKWIIAFFAINAIFQFYLFFFWLIIDFFFWDSRFSIVQSLNL